MPNYQKKFSKLYDKYVDKIYRFVFLKVSSQEVAEDLCSDIFTKFWKSFRKGTEIENPQAFIYKIAKNAVADHYRRGPKFQIISTEVTQIAAPDPNLEDNQQLQSDIGVVRNCLAKLSNDHQDVIIWKYLDGLSIKDIAEITERPEGTVRVMVHRALKELREKMENL